jgi:putative ABC transport system ATP-binding protein
MPSAEKKVIISIQQVSKSYQQGKVKVHAVKDLSLDIEEGEFTALCGPSGSGKTTLLNMIGGLDLPTEGVIKLESQELAQLSRMALSHLRRDRIGFVFQAYNLIPVMTAYENAEFVLALQGTPKAQRRERVMSILKQVGLQGLESRRPDEMSGGQQQRVAIARAIVTHPAVVLADEPTANVDSENAEALLDLMEELNQREGITFIFSTHDPRVMKRARRLIYLRDGQLDPATSSEQLPSH